MRRCLALVSLLFACTVSVDGADLELSGGSSRGAPKRGVNESLPDLGVGADLWEPRLDVEPFDQYLCSAIDILFVVDNSGSMSDEQDKLVAEVPGFVDRLTELGLGVESGLHVGVVTTDDYRQNAPSSCQFLGALVNKVQLQTCGPYASGARYMTEEDDLDEAFSCAAQVGALGDGSERPIDAMLAALDEWPNRPGGCNEGFSRSELAVDEHGGNERAALVVIMLTDEDDIFSIGQPAEWVEHLAWLRGGTLDDTAVIAITGDGECGETPTRVREFLDLLPYSYEGSMCGEDFAEVFVDAVPFVQEGCGLSYTPEG